MKHVVKTPMYGIMKENLDHCEVTTTTENKVRWSLVTICKQRMTMREKDASPSSILVAHMVCL